MTSQPEPVRDRQSPRGLTPQYRAAYVRSQLRVFSGEISGRQIVMACGTKTEFCHLTGVNRYGFDGETRDPQACRTALQDPRRAFDRPARTSEAFGSRPLARIPG